MKNGFTLIELMMVVAILGTVGVIAMGAINGTPTPSSLQFGVNGMTETRCINGFQFVVGSSGSAQQVLNETGGGVKCTNQ